MYTQESNDIKVIGLIAGAGSVPPFFAKKAAAMGLQVISIGLSSSIDKTLKPYVEKNYLLILFLSRHEKSRSSVA